MIASTGVKVARAAARNFSTAVVRAHAERGQWPKAGSNLPFDITNRYKLTAYFIAFTGSAFGIPFYFWVNNP